MRKNVGPTFCQTFLPRFPSKRSVCPGAKRKWLSHSCHWDGPWSQSQPMASHLPANQQSTWTPPPPAKKRHQHEHQQHYHHLGKSPIHLLSLHNGIFMQKYDYLCELEFETHLSVQICIRQTIDVLSFICNASARARLLGITAATVSRHDAWTVRL